MNNPFLTCQWKNLAIVNFEIDPETLLPFVPPGTELDFFNGKTYVSLLGFQYDDTKVKGLSLPGHRAFSEVNLRFYVKRNVADECRRGVCFIKEIVGLPAVSCVANAFYGESFQTIKTTSHLEQKALGPYIQYQITGSHQKSFLEMMTGGEKKQPEPDSIQEFIICHKWAYSTLKNGRTLEYRIERPAWHYWPANFVCLDFDAQTLYGKALAETLRGHHHSAFLVDGSAVEVQAPRMIEEVPGNSILIFDGVCVLCNSFVDFILKQDKKKHFVFLSNQSEKAKKILKIFGLEDKTNASVYLVQGGKIYKESAAALRILLALGFPFSILYIFIAVPNILRNIIYRFIALNRYRWFGKRESCRIINQ